MWRCAFRLTSHMAHAQSEAAGAGAEGRVHAPGDPGWVRPRMRANPHRFPWRNIFATLV